MHQVTYFENGIRKQAEFIGSASEIRERLTSEGKVVLEVKKPFTLFQPKAKRKELAAVLVAIGDLLQAGVPLSKTLETTIQSLPKGSSLINILNAIKTAVQQGRELSSSMAAYHSIFGSTTISMIQAGEKSGKLAESLLGASQYITNIEESQNEMKKTLSYPLVVFVISLIALVVNTQFVIPKILSSQLFKTALKGQTNGFIVALSALSKIVPVVFAVLAVAVVVVAILYKSRQEEMERLLMSIPLIRELFFYQGYYVAFFSMAKLMESGIQLTPALSIVQDTSSTIAIRNEFDGALRKVKEGESFSYGFTCLNPIEKTMLDVAQNSNRVTENLALVADRFYRGYMDKVKALGPKVYAFALIFAGGIFLLMVMGIMIPYSKLLGGLRG
jgi:type II secretory pathway component PulF